MVGCVGVSRINFGGNLALFWRENLNVSLHSLSPGHIDTIIDLNDGRILVLMGFYKNPGTTLRCHFWELLKRLKPLDNVV